MVGSAKTHLGRYVAYLLAKGVEQDTIDTLINDEIDNVEVLVVVDSGVIKDET